MGKFDALLKSVSFEKHVGFCMLIRIVLIVYGEIQDEISEVPYTDIDYKVVTDGARHILQNESPFQRHTYRYSPLLAFLLIPNILLHKTFGKLFFSICDILVGVVIKMIVAEELRTTFWNVAEKHFGRSKKITYNELRLPKRCQQWPEFAAYSWLYNPLTIVIATRGNGDSVTSLLVLATIYNVQKQQMKLSQYFVAGLCYGLAVHLRIYPVVLALTFYLNISKKKIKSSLGLISILLCPNSKQICFVLATLLSSLGLTCFFNSIYGYEYIQEAYLYHLTRKDIRHNFSMFFLMQYLSDDADVTLIDKVLTLLPQLVLLVYLSCTLGLDRRTLGFCCFTQVFIMVAYNSVVTSQYFVWFLSLLPLCVKDLRNISSKLAASYFVIWMLAQGMWLLPAYLLEFKSWNTFNLIGIQSLCFFFVNIFILQRLISNFDILAEIKFDDSNFIKRRKNKNT